MNLISWVPPIQDCFSKYFPNIDIRWINFLFILIFLGIMYWILQGLNQRLEESENKKPLISVVPRQIPDSWYLEVTNNGARANFSAVVIIIPEQPKYMGERYEALWAKNMTDKTELMNGQTDEIKIASIEFTYSKPYFVMNAYDAVKKSPSFVRRIESKQFVNKVNRLQVIISSCPVLKNNKPFIRTYDIGSHYLNESKHQYKYKKLDSIPYNFVDNDDIDVNN